MGECGGEWVGVRDSRVSGVVTDDTRLVVTAN